MGVLGYGTLDNIGDNETPAMAGDIAVGTIRSFAAGESFTCAQLAGGAIRCWGRNDFGELGLGNTTSIGDNEVPTVDTPIATDIHKLEVGGDHACVLRMNGTVRCWGWNMWGQLGYGNMQYIGDDETAAVAGDVALGGAAIDLTAAEDHTCAVLEGGAVKCWGWNMYGQLGYATTNQIGDNELPLASPVALGGAATAVDGGYGHTCALMATGAVRCWGRNDLGQLGYGNTNQIGDNETPDTAGDVPLGGRAVAIAVGNVHTCALLDTGGVRCWGAGQSGSLGYGNTNNVGDNETPAMAGDVPLGEPATAIYAGGGHTCAVLQTTGAVCWGSNGQGQLGYGNTNNIGDNEPASAGGVVPIESFN